MSASVKVRVTPRSSRDRIVSWADGVLTVKLVAAPVEGAANEALVKLLAKTFGLRRSQIRIKSGESSRLKLILIEGMAEADLALLLRPYQT